MSNIYGEKFANLQLQYNLTIDDFIEVSPLRVVTDDKPITLSDLNVTLEEVYEMEQAKELRNNYELVILCPNILVKTWHYLGFRRGVFAEKSVQALNYILENYELTQVEIEAFCSVLDTEVYFIYDNLSIIVKCLKKKCYTLINHLISYMSIKKSDVEEQWLSIVLNIVYEYMQNPNVSSYCVDFVKWVNKDINVLYCLDNSINYYRKLTYFPREYRKDYVIKLLYFYKYTSVTSNITHTTFNLMCSIVFSDEYLLSSILDDEKIANVYLYVITNAPINQTKRYIIYLLTKHVDDKIYKLTEKIIRLDHCVLYILLQLSRNKTVQAIHYATKIVEKFGVNIKEELNKIIIKEKADLYIFLHEVTPLFITTNDMVDLYMTDPTNVNLLLYCIHYKADISRINFDLPIPGTPMNVREFIDKMTK